MNLNEQVLRIQNLNYFLSEQIFANPTPITSSDIVIQGPFELRGDGNVYNMRKDITLAKGATLKLRYNVRNNYTDTVKIKNFKYNGVGLKKTEWSNTTIEPKSFTYLTITIGTQEKKQPDLPGMDGASNNWGEVNPSYLNNSTFSGRFEVEGPKIASALIGVTSNQNFVTKELPPVSIKVPVSYYLVDPKEMGLDKVEIPVLGPVFDWMSSWDHHDWLLFAEIAFSILSMMTPAGWIAGAIALGAGGANAYSYFKEGDNFNGWFNLIFSIIPAGELFKAIPVVSKYGVEKSLQILWRAKSAKITKAEFKWLKEFMKQSRLNKSTIEFLLKSNLARKFMKFIYSLPTKKILAILVTLKKVGIFTGKLVLVVGGISLGLEYVLYLLGVEEKDVKKGTMQEQDWNLVHNNKDDIKEQATSLLETGLEKLDEEEVIKAIGTTGQVNEGQFNKTLDSINLQNKKYFDSLANVRVNVTPIQ